MHIAVGEIKVALAAEKFGVPFTLSTMSVSMIRLISHGGFGFHSADALIALVYLCCTGIVIDLPR
jgi:hypothetical protein